MNWDGFLLVLAYALFFLLAIIMAWVDEIKEMYALRQKRKEKEAEARIQESKERMRQSKQARQDVEDGLTQQ